jgi:hypothetical protein
MTDYVNLSQYALVLFYSNKGHVLRMNQNAPIAKHYNRYEMRIHKQRALVFCPIGTPYRIVKTACEIWEEHNRE